MVKNRKDARNAKEYLFFAFFASLRFLQKQAWITFALAMALSGCHPKGHNTSVMETSYTSIELRCHYLLDQKYAGDQDPSKVEVWKAQVQADASKGQTEHYDLFNHMGGGPAGAEWNSDGALYFTGLLPFHVNSVSKVQLFLNDREWKEDLVVETQDVSTWIAAEVPGPTWMRLLRPIRKSDYEMVYALEEIVNYDRGINGPLGIGEMLTVRLRFSVGNVRKEFVRAFAVAYGE